MVVVYEYSIIRKAKRALKDKEKSKSDIKNTFWVGYEPDQDTNQKEGGLNIVLYSEECEHESSKMDAWAIQIEK